MTRATECRTALRVWVARPLPAGARTAERVAALGHRPLLAPVLDLALSGAPAPDGPFDALVLTSASAVPALAGSPLAALPAYCVGARTACAARAAGLVSIHEAGGDARALANLIGAALPRGARLLHAAGRERKDEPGDTLAARGYRLTVWVAYAARPLPALPEPVAEALEAGALDAALHYSRRSAATALGLARAAGREDAFATWRIIACRPTWPRPWSRPGSCPMSSRHGRTRRLCWRACSRPVRRPFDRTMTQRCRRPFARAGSDAKGRSIVARPGRDPAPRSCPRRADQAAFRRAPARSHR